MTKTIRLADKLRKSYRRLGWKLNDFWWEIKWRIHPKHRYHIVRLRDYNYKYGWCDRDYAIFMAAFTLLCDYYENENWKIFDWNHDPGHAFAIREIKSLYFWYRHQRELEQLEMLYLARRYGYNEEWENYFTWLENRDDIQLARLMKIRSYLWT